jgi:hypothetical protein
MRITVTQGGRQLTWPWPATSIPHSSSCLHPFSGNVNAQILMSRSSRRATSIKLRAISFARPRPSSRRKLSDARFSRFQQSADPERTLQGRIAKTRVGTPEPPFGFGKWTTTIVPTSCTSYFRGWFSTPSGQTWSDHAS